MQGIEQDSLKVFIHHLGWGFDGHKLDNIYFVPPCYDSAYHERPEDSVDAFAAVYRRIHETTRALKPHSVTQI